MPRGPALGFVGHSPQEDTYLKSRDEMLDELVTLLGGRAAEEEVLGESYSGSVDDLARVHLLCKQMVAEFGMGVPIDAEGRPPIALPTGDYALSDKTRRDVDLACDGAAGRPTAGRAFCCPPTGSASTTWPQTHWSARRSPARTSMRSSPLTG